MPLRQRLVDAPGVSEILGTMAAQVIERCQGPAPVVLVGIQRRGVELSERLAALMTPRLDSPLALGKLDITLYRDDLQTIGPRPMVAETVLPASLDGATVVIVDDVLFTGRTVRAALDEIADFGRPRRVLLAVLVDRGGRELPIHPDIVGVTHQAGPQDLVEVKISELDGEDAVYVVQNGGDS